MLVLVESLIENNVDLHFAKRELEAVYIKRILNLNNGNVSASARSLGMHRNTLAKRIKELNIDTRAD